jgi:5-oxoprolinase (ATP-hydrolysing)
VDCRYRGQSHELTVPDVASFHEEHERRNGYARPGHPVEVVALRATVTGAAPVEFDALPAPPSPGAAPDVARPRRGPAVLAAPDCTVWVPEGWEAGPGAAGAVVLRRVGAP